MRFVAVSLKEGAGEPLVSNTGESQDEFMNRAFKSFTRFMSEEDFDIQVLFFSLENDVYGFPIMNPLNNWW